MLLVIVLHFSRRFYFEDFRFFEVERTSNGLNDANEASSCNTDLVNGINKNNEGSTISIKNTPGYIIVSNIEQYC